MTQSWLHQFIETESVAAAVVVNDVGGRALDDPPPPLLAKFPCPVPELSIHDRRIPVESKKCMISIGESPNVISAGSRRNV